MREKTSQKPQDRPQSHGKALHRSLTVQGAFVALVGFLATMFVGPDALHMTPYEIAEAIFGVGAFGAVVGARRALG